MMKGSSFLVTLFISLSSLTILPLFQLRQIQLVEVVFLSSIPLVLFYSIKYRQMLSASWLSILVFFYLLLNIFNFYVHGNSIDPLEFLGSIYLPFLYFATTILLQINSNAQQSVKTGIKGLWVATVASGILGFLLFKLNISNDFVVLYMDYPYLGNVVRWCGFSWCTIYVGCIVVSTLLILPGIKQKKIKLLFALVSLIFCGFSLSKECVLALALLMVYFVFTNLAKLPRYRFLVLFSLSTGLLLVINSFFIFKVNVQSLSRHTSNNIQIDSKPIYGNSFLEVYPTTYFHMLKNAINLFSEHILTGIGTGNFQNELELNKLTGRYPKSLTTNEAHDLYWGPLSELGVAYLLFILPLFPLLIHMVYNAPISDELKLVLVLCILYFSISYLVGGSRYFRHFWIFLGIVDWATLTKLKNRWEINHLLVTKTPLRNP